MVDRSRLVVDDAFRFVVRHVDHVVLDRRDFDAAIVTCDRLPRVAFQVSGRVCAVAKALDRTDDVGLLCNDGLAETPRPVEIFIQQSHDLRVVQQRDHRVVPAVVGLQRRVFLQLFEEALRLDQLQGIRGCGQDDRKQVVGVQRDRADELLQLALRQQRDILVAGRCAGFERFVVGERGPVVVDGDLGGCRRCGQHRKQRYEADWKLCM